MDITLKIKIRNSVMDRNPDELRKILEYLSGIVATHVRRGTTDVYPVLDSGGNRVGTYRVSR